ncbi:MAG: hypothetical protein EXQ88_01705 [Alphaproteobacteria bacterium]|nr:hypothetical protein [Alphaproteobacteria bacterium]
MKETRPFFLALILLLSAAYPAWAQFSITDPTVERGQLTVDWLSAFYSNGDQRHGHELDISYGLTSFWAPGLALAIEKAGGEELRATSVQWSNVFALGKPWASADFGFEANLSAPLASGEAFAIQAGPALSFTTGPIKTTLNATVSREFGANHQDGVEFGYGVQALYATNFNLYVGFEAYGAVPNIGNAPPLRDTEHRIGPVIS